MYIFNFIIISINSINIAKKKIDDLKIQKLIKIIAIYSSTVMLFTEWMHSSLLIK